MPLESVSPSELLTYLVDTLNQRELQKLFNEYGDVQDNIILLHRLVEDAKARKDRDERYMARRVGTTRRDLCSNCATARGRDASFERKTIEGPFILFFNSKIRVY